MELPYISIARGCTVKIIPHLLEKKFNTVAPPCNIVSTLIVVIVKLHSQEKEYNDNQQLAMRRYGICYGEGK